MFVYIVLTIICFEYARRKYCKLEGTVQDKAGLVRSRKILLFKAGLICGFLWVFTIFNFFISINGKMADIYENAKIFKHPVTLVFEMVLSYGVFVMIAKRLMRYYISAVEIIGKPIRAFWKGLCGFVDIPRKIIDIILGRDSNPPPPIPTDEDKIGVMKKCIVNGIAEWSMGEGAIDQEIARKELESMLFEGATPVQSSFFSKIGMIEYALEKVNSNKLSMNIYLIVLKDKNPLKITLKTQKTFTWESIPQDIRAEFIRSGKSILTYRLYPGGADNQ